MEKINAGDASSASVTRGGGMEESVEARGTYTVTCVGPDGQVKWVDEYSNLVTTVGKNNLLDVYLGASGQTTTWYLGLVNSGATYNAADTAASHSGWTENTDYSNGTRPSASFAAASAGSKATSAASTFNINNTATIGGTFLISNSTKGGTTGTLYSAGNFTGGNRSVANGDTLNVSYTASA